MAENDFEGPKHTSPFVKELLLGLKTHSAWLEEMQAIKRNLEQAAMKVGSLCAFLFGQCQAYRQGIQNISPEADLNQLTDF